MNNLVKLQPGEVSLAEPRVTEKEQVWLPPKATICLPGLIEEIQVVDFNKLLPLL